jgi:uncharacterized membrane protein YjgN (DUF898 family)
MAAVEYKPAGSLAGLLVKNALKNLITLYIYRFWAKTSVRRYFWQAIRLDGDPFEYTGLGRELLIGFLIVVAILAPIVIAWNAVRAALRTDPVVLGIAQLLYLVALSSLVIVAGFRARRYRLSRTRWRGIRAGQDGSTWRYLGLAMAWGTLALVTLGLASPWMRTALQRYRTNHTLFGDQHFSFEARALPLFARWLVVVVVAGLPIVIAVVIGGPALLALLATAGKPTAQATILAELPRLMVLVASPYVALILGGIAYAWYSAAEFRYFAAHTRLGGVRFASTARGGRIVGRVTLCLLADLGCLIAVVALFIVLARASGVFAKSTGPTPATALPVEILVAIVIVVLLLFFVFRFLWTLIVTAGVLRHLCETLDVSGVEGLSQIAQSAATQPKYGEGLADSFDIGAM